MKKKTLYHIILDESGSMSDVLENTITGFNEQINRIGQLEREFPEQSISIGVTTFNAKVRHLYFDQPASNAVRIDQRSYKPNNNTALLDAIGSTVQHLENLQHQQQQEMETTVVVIILTDGYENASRLFNLEMIKQTIARLESTDRWTFSFLGATIDALDVAESLSIKRNNSMSFEKKDMNKAVWDKLNTSMMSYMSKKEFGGDLNDLYDSKKK